MTTLITWALTAFTIMLPPEFQLENQHHEYVKKDSIIKADFYYARWQAPDGKTLIAHYWEPMPIDRGFAVFKPEKWSILVGDQTFTVGEATQFLSLNMHTFVASTGYTQPKATLIIFSRNMEREEFMKIIGNSKIERVKNTNQNIENKNDRHF